MYELNTFEIDEVSGGHPVVWGARAVVAVVVALVGIGFADGYKEEEKKSETAKKKAQ